MKKLLFFSLFTLSTVTLGMEDLTQIYLSNNSKQAVYLSYSIGGVLKKDTLRNEFAESFKLEKDSTLSIYADEDKKYQVFQYTATGLDPYIGIHIIQDEKTDRPHANILGTFE